jgi:hypothetical protein
MKYKLIFILLSLTAISCSKTEGEGGTASITGKVFFIRYDAGYNFAVDTVPAVEEDVYIIYGTDGPDYDDDYKSSYDGTYKFRNLLKGTYKIFAYTNDSTGASRGLVDNSLPKLPVFIEVGISSDEDKTIEPVYIINNDL